MRQSASGLSDFGDDRHIVVLLQIIGKDAGIDNIDLSPGAACRIMTRRSIGKLRGLKLVFLRAGERVQDRCIEMEICCEVGVLVDERSFFAIRNIEAHPQMQHFIIDALWLVKSLENIDDIGSSPSGLDPEHQAIAAVILGKRHCRILDETASESLRLEMVDRMIVPVILEENHGRNLRPDPRQCQRNSRRSLKPSRVLKTVSSQLLDIWL
jgi:hypothetical protein